MGIQQISYERITCDNPACPGNDLDTKSREGWLIVYAEVYGQPGTQAAFCCSECLGAATATTPNPLLPPAPEVVAPA